MLPAISYKFAIAFFALLTLVSPAFAADRLILRNLDIILDRTVTQIDEDGIELDAARPRGTSHLTWDEIERGTVALDQAKFNRLLAELGPPLYRVRQRLKTGDYEALAEPAEQLYPLFAARKSQTAYMVCQAVMWSRMAAGQREAAVEPYLRCFEILRSGRAKLTQLPGLRRLAVEPKSAITTDLLPVWFDAAASKAALPVVHEAIRGMNQPRPEGVYIYYATLALAAGETAESERVMRLFRGDEPLAAQWRDIVLAQQEVLAGAPGPNIHGLQTAVSNFAPASRPAALYWLGRAHLQSPDASVVRDGVLELLTLPAAHATTDPHLAAAALFHAAEALDKLKDTKGSAALRQELAAQFGNTPFGAKDRPRER